MLPIGIGNGIALAQYGAVGDPTLVGNYDFINSESLNGNPGNPVVITRASSATRFNSGGVMELVGNNVARFDYDPVTLALKGLLIEGDSINQHLHSEDLGNIAYTPVNVTVSADTDTAPDNTNTMDSIFETVTNAVHRLDTASFGTAIGQVYYFAAFVRKLGRQYVSLTISDTAQGNLDWATFDLDAGTVDGSSGGALSPVIEDVGGGTYRISLGQSVGAVTTRASIYDRSTNGDPTADAYVGDITQGVVAWGLQIEFRAFITSYMPTTGASFSRADESGKVSGLTINQTEGTLFVEATVNSADGTQTLMAINDNTFNEDIHFELLGATPSFRAFDGGAPQWNIPTVPLAPNVVGKYAGSWNAAANCVSDGVFRGADGVFTLPTIDQYSFGAAGPGAEQIFGHVRRFQHYERTLSIPEMQSLTTL